MVIYNITYQVSHSIAADWLEWMEKEHIPAIMATGLFTGNRLFRLLEQEDAEGPTYVLQFSAAAKHDYQQYLEEYAEGFRQQAAKRWTNGYIAFRTLMQLVD
jgi:hypothetical protein